MNTHKAIAVLVALSLVCGLSSCRNASSSDNDSEKSDNDTTSYKLKPKMRSVDETEFEEEEFEEELVEPAPVPEEIKLAERPRATEIKNADEVAEAASNQQPVPVREIHTEIVEEKVKSDNNKVYDMALVEQKPTFPGGDSALYKWISSQLNYPPTAAEEGVQGRVTVGFVIEKDGSITNVRVMRGKHPDLDREAVRVVKKMPKWNPGRVNGAPVRVTYILPINFKLQQ